MKLHDFVEGFNFDRINLFPTRQQVGTFAYDMPQSVNAKTTNERINKLNSIIKSQFKAHNKALLGQEVITILRGQK